MKRDGKGAWRQWTVFASVLLAIALVFASGVLDKQRVWTEVPLSYVDGKRAWSLEEGDAYGFVSEGPGFHLPAGRYRLKWQIEGDGNNVLHLLCTNDVVVSPERIETQASEWEGEAWFELPEAVHNFTIRVEFTSGTWMKVHNFRLYSPMYTDHAWSFAIAACLLCLLYGMRRRGVLMREWKQDALLIAAAVLFVSLPALSQDNIAGKDISFHAPRLMNLAEALSKGQFPARVGGYTYNGYGAVTSVFYPDIVLTPFALMLLGGASVQYVINICCIVMHAVSALLCYAAAKRMYGEKSSALCAAILYTCAQYRLRNTYMRFAMGEMMAMAVLPLFILGLWEVFFGNRRRWPVLTLGATLVFQCHLITTLLCGCLAAVMAVIYLPRLIREKRLGSVALACISTLLMNMCTLIPLLTCYLQGITSMPEQFGFEESALSVEEIFFQSGYLGLHLWLGIAALLVCDRGTGGERPHRLALLLAGLGAAAAMMATELFPWSYAVKMTGGLVRILQFTQRLLTLSALPLALAGGYGLSRLIPGRRVHAGFLVLVLTVISASPYMERIMTEKGRYEFGLGADPFVLFPEYQFENTDLADTRSRQPILGGDVQLTQYEKDGTRIEAQVSAQQGGEIAFPLFGFDGYAAELNGERVYWWRAENNRLTLDIPAGTQSELHIWFEGNALWKIADGVSLLSAAVLLLFVCRRRKGERHPHQEIYR